MHYTVSIPLVLNHLSILGDNVSGVPSPNFVGRVPCLYSIDAHTKMVAVVPLTNYAITLRSMFCYAGKCFAVWLITNK